MTRDDRFYAFIIARTSRSRAHIRRISVHKRWLKVSVLGLAVVGAALMYGFYGLIQQAEHLRTEHDKTRVFAPRTKSRSKQLLRLNNRVNALRTLRAARRDVWNFTGRANGAPWPGRSGTPHR